VQEQYHHSMGTGLEQRADREAINGSALGRFDESPLSNKRRKMHGAMARCTVRAFLDGAMLRGPW
jgi:hypothetical protein